MNGSLRPAIFFLLGSLVLTSVLFARQGMVRLKDGSQINGDIDNSNPDELIVVRNGIQVTIARSDIDTVEYPANPNDEFILRMAKLDPKDAAGRVEIAQWAYDNNRPDLARKALGEALQIQPGNPQAVDLLRLIDHPVPATQPLGATRPVVVRAQTEPTDRRYLSEDQINEIRQLEMKPDDNLRVTFAHNVRQRFLAEGTEEPAAFYGLPAFEQAREILNRGDASLAGDVRIASDPSSIVAFRDHVLPVVLGSCATAGCHNAENNSAGDFRLLTGDDSPAARYTNFYLLQSYTTTIRARDGHSVPRDMIDRTYPQRSLLIQYALPARLAETPHPVVPNFRAPFGGPTDIHRAEWLHWIGVSLRPDRGEYPDVTYRPPWSQPTTQP